MRNVFLSFSGANRDEKNRIRSFLEKKDSSLKIFDSDEFCGAEYSEECIEKIKESQIFVSIVSEATMDGGGYCINEVITARQLECAGKLNILLFKLCDAPLRKGFEFQLNNHSDLNNLTRGTELGYEKLYEKTKWFLDCRENGKPQFENVNTVLSHYEVAPLKDNDFHSDIARDLHGAFLESKLVVLQGFPGMGRMHAAKTYLGLYPDENYRAYRVDVKNGDLRDFIKTVAIPSYDIGGMMRQSDDERRYAENLAYLEQMSSAVLIIVQNANIGRIDEELRRDLSRIGARLLVITSNSELESGFPTVHINTLSDDELTELFFERCPLPDDDKERAEPYLPELFFAAGNHTGTVIFLAKRFAEMESNADDIIDFVEGLTGGESEAQALLLAASDKYFSVSELTDGELDILFMLAYLPYDLIDLGDLKDFFRMAGMRDFSSLGRLKNKGYIEIEDGAVSIVDAISSAVRTKARPSERAIHALLAVLYDQFAVCSAGQFGYLCSFLKAFGEELDIPYLANSVGYLTIAFIFMSKYSESSADRFFEEYMKFSVPRLDELEEIIRKLSVRASAYMLCTYSLISDYFYDLAVESGFAEEFSDIIGGNGVDDISDEYFSNESFGLVKSLLDEKADEIGSDNYQKLVDMTEDCLSLVDRGELDLRGEGFLKIIPALSALIRMGKYDKVLYLTEKVVGSLSSEAPEYSVITPLMHAFMCFSHYNSGKDEDALIYGEKFLSADGFGIPGAESLRVQVQLMLLKLDVKHKRYEGVGRRVDALFGNIYLDQDEELMLLDTYASIQIFGGDWYKLRDFIKESALKRFGNVDSEHVDSLRDKLDECEHVIEAMESDSDGSSSERDIEDGSAESMEYYHKLLSSQIGKKKYDEVFRIADTILKRDLSVCTDGELLERARSASERMRKKSAGGASPFDGGEIAEVFSLVREAGFRILGMKHHKIQLVSGILMLMGYSPEIKNGEGKTFTIVLPAAALALSGRHVNVITSSSYLSERDRLWMKDIYEFLGISVGGATKGDPREFLNGDVVYAAFHTAILAYVNNGDSPGEGVRSRIFDAAIVDEADLIMVDGVNDVYPLTVPFKTNDKERIIKAFKLIRSGEIAEGEDYEIDGQRVNVYPTAVRKLCNLFGIGIQDTYEVTVCKDIIYFSLLALRVFKRDVDYSYRGVNVLLENRSTGTSSIAVQFLSGALRYKDFGFVPEMKRSIKLHVSSPRVAFSIYKTLICTSGTMMASRAVFEKHYGLRCINIPTNKEIIRKDRRYTLYLSDATHRDAIIERTRAALASGRPVLIVAPNAQRQKVIEGYLKYGAIPYNSVNYINEADANEVFAVAGIPGTVTVSTNIAGRGVDIVLGYNPKYCAVLKMREDGYSAGDIKEAQLRYPTDEKRSLMLRSYFNMLLSEYKEKNRPIRERLISDGGLCVIGTSIMTSFRHEQQMRGRAGRQGEPGESEFLVSINDENMLKLFRNDPRAIFQRFGEPREGIKSKIFSDALVSAQSRTEFVYLDTRKVRNQDHICFEFSERYFELVEGFKFNDSYLERAVTEALLCTDDGEALGILESVREKNKELAPKKKRLFGIFKKKEPELLKLEAILSALGPSVTRNQLNQAFDTVRRKRWSGFIERCKSVADDENTKNRMLPKPKPAMEVIKRYEKRVEARFTELMRDIIIDTLKGVGSDGLTVNKSRFENLSTIVSRLPRGFVMPNSPCPCGSGKKHKYCCGRKPSDGDESNDES